LLGPSDFRRKQCWTVSPRFAPKKGAVPRTRQWNKCCAARWSALIFLNPTLFIPAMHRISSPAGMALWLSSWGYGGIFICVFIGNLGIPIPEELVLLVAGVLVGRKALDLGTLYVVAILSAVTGDTCGFLVGRTGGQQLFEWLATRFPFIRRRYQYLQSFFRAHGNRAVFLARFLMGARFMAGPMAGAAGMRFWNFLGWNLLGACVWCSVIITLGYFVGNQLDRVFHLVQKAGRWMAAAAFIAVVTIWLLWRRKHHRLPHPT